MYDPPEMNSPEGRLFIVIHTFYGIPEPGLHWDLTHLDNHSKRLNINYIISDPCLSIRHKDGKLDGMEILQAEYCLEIGTPKFMEDEEESAKNLKAKPKTVLSKTAMSFNGSETTSNPTDKTIIMKKTNTIIKVKLQDDEERVIIQPAKMQYIGVN